MELILYKFEGEINSLNKRLLNGLKIDGNIRDSFNLYNFNISFEAINSHDIYDVIVANNNVIGYNSNLNIIVKIYNMMNSLYNYVYIKDLDKYYYITNIKIINQTILEFTLELDYLMSFKNEILSQTAIIERNEYDYDETILDDLVQVTSEPIIEYERVVLDNMSIYRKLLRGVKDDGTIDNSDFVNIVISPTV